MKIFLPVVVHATQAHLTQRQIEDLRLNLQKVLKKLESKTISQIEVSEGFEYAEKGPWEIHHEFDDEPTYVSIETEDEENNSITLGSHINPSLRHSLAQLIQPILNADTTQRLDK